MKNLILIFAFVFSSNLSWAYSVQPEMQSMSSRSQAQVDNYAEFLNRAYPEANINLSEEGLLTITR